MKILITAFGWHDLDGGGTIYSREIATALQQRGHQVMVFYAGPPLAGHPPYTVVEEDTQGIQAVGVYNRPAFLLDPEQPEREVNDPQVVEIFSHLLDRFQPDVVHYQNFVGLSLGIARPVWERGIPNFFSLYNHWILCPTLYLMLPDQSACRGVNATGSNCLNCTQTGIDPQRYVQRRDQLRKHWLQYIDTSFITCRAPEDLLIENGYTPEKINVLVAENQKAVNLWQEVGKNRQPVTPAKIRFAYMGSVIPIKGVTVLIQAIQQLRGDFSLRLYGKAPPAYLDYLKRLDQTGKVEFMGHFDNTDQGSILAHCDIGIVPSVCQEPGAFVTIEFQAARVPVLGSDICGIPERIQTRAGQTFRPNDPAALAQAMQALLDRPEQVSEWQARLQAPHTFEKYIEHLEQYYEEGFTQGHERKAQRQWQHFYQQRVKAPELSRHAWPEPWQVLSGSPGLLDLKSVAALEQLTPTELEASSQIWVTSQALHQHLLARFPQAQGKTQVVPLPLPEPRSLHALELPTEKTNLLWLNLSGKWQPALKAYLQHAQAEHDLSCVLLSDQPDLEALYDQLQNWMLAEGFDPEAGPELLVLDLAEQQSPLEAVLASQPLWLATEEELLSPLLEQTLAHGGLIAWPENQAFPEHDLLASLKPQTLKGDLEHWLHQASYQAWGLA